MDLAQRLPFAPWDRYTPTWTAASTNPVLNDGTLIGRYMLIGRTVICRIHLVAGASTTFGSGAFRFSLPLTAATTGTNMPQSGVAKVLDEGVAWYDGQAYVGSGDAYVQVQIGSVSGTLIKLDFATATFPMTFGNTDKINIGPFVYEAA